MIRVVKLKPILGVMAITFLSFILCLSFNYIASASKNNEYFKYTIVLDAGHGGWDGGCVGTTTGVTEAEINLQITKKLKEYLTNFGFNVVLTRNGDDALGKDKTSDMEKRKQIINRVNPFMVISIHANSFTDSSEYGTQTFYKQNNEKSKELADSIQEQMKVHLSNARENSNHGEYYMLECSSAISCIVECGFLSNSNDEELLNDEEYRNNVAYSIYSGIVKYLICSGSTTTQNESVS